jgi:hypothetical protein
MIELRRRILVVFVLFLVAAVGGYMCLRLASLQAQEEKRERIAEEDEGEPAEAEPEMVSDEAYQLLKKAEKLEEAGRDDLADRLRARARQVEAQARDRGEREKAGGNAWKLREEAQRQRSEAVNQAIRARLEVAKKLKAVGRLEAAEEVIRRVKALQREVRQDRLREREVRELKLRSREEEAPSPRRILGEIAELRENVNALREEMAEMRELLQELLEIVERSREGSGLEE